MFDRQDLLAACERVKEREHRLPLPGELELTA
jgi:hypothetical protein